MEFYEDSEPWMFPTNRYPTWDDCMRYYMSRMKGAKKVSQKSIFNELSEAVHKIWKSGDGCPKSKSNIMNQFEKTVLPQYQRYRRGDAGNRSKKKKTEPPPQSVENQPQKSKRQEGKERKDAWMADCGDQLFDVFSEIEMVKV